ncbi:MAG: hypothetical protein M0Z95_18600 [Actinomycetota bacterium]|jgi:hypothetical protein|nr:hypothetical protein [Actinomycetota bacterium]
MTDGHLPTREPASVVGRRLLDECSIALGAAVEGLRQYTIVLTELGRALEGDAQNETFEAWLVGQRDRVAKLIALLDDTVLDAFLRIADRNVRIRHFEEGGFV